MVGPWELTERRKLPDGGDGAVQPWSLLSILGGGDDDEPFDNIQDGGGGGVDGAD